jgi:hypothetical protein
VAVEARSSSSAFSRSSRGRICNTARASRSHPAASFGALVTN